MGKASKVKGELIEVRELVELIQVLKDVADMKYHSLLLSKDHFDRFTESFVDFFRLASFSQVRHPLISNNNPATGLVMVTTEQGFVGDLNSKVAARAAQEYEKDPNTQFIVLGKKGPGKLEQFRIKPAKVFEEYEEKGLYETALEVKDYLVDQVMTGKLGHIVLVYPWPKDFTALKPKFVRLLPCEDLLPKQDQTIEKFQHVIEESSPTAIIGHLANIWLTSKLYEILYDTTLAAAAAQSAQLDNSSGKMRKEALGVKLKYRKARKGDIDNSLREVFSARMMAMK